MHKLGMHPQQDPDTCRSVEVEPVEALRKALFAEGMRIEVNTSVCSMRKNGDQTLVEVDMGGSREELSAERVLLAVGTAPATGGIGLEHAGVELDARGFVKVDEMMRTTAPGIWAAGDVTGGMMIATVGAREGDCRSRQHAQSRMRLPDGLSVGADGHIYRPGGGNGRPYRGCRNQIRP